MSKTTSNHDPVNNPEHYGGKDNPYEVFKVIRAWGLQNNAWLFNVIKYVARHDKKGNPLQDLRKARVYLDEAIKDLEGQ
jgi:hypothetical protein